jgi:hypothetical protein
MASPPTTTRTMCGVSCSTRVTMPALTARTGLSAMDDSLLSYCSVVLLGL